MRSVKLIVAAGAASMLSSMALAADMAIAPPPMQYAPPPVEDFGGWYLRGDIGMTNQSLKSLDQRSITPTTQSTGMGFDSAGTFGLGVGYQFNHWLRVDATGEFRGRSNFHGSQFDPNPPNGTAFYDNYSGSKSEWLALANVYADLGTWWCITPFVGVGIGGSYNTISGFRDDGFQIGGGSASTYAANASKWNFAWALHAGVAYKVTPGFTVELAYRYLNLGDAVTGPTNSFDGVTVVNGGPFTMKGITSNDVRLGVRWNLESPPVYAPPLIRKG
jgi:opacity protein-like surface antigen